jgi:large subunit ribosomal protein L10
MKPEKLSTVSDITEKVNASSSMYLVDFSRMTVPMVTQFRNELRQKGVSFRVAKNTLIRRSFAACGVTGLDNELQGPSAIIFADGEDPIAPAKLIVDFHKANADFLAVKSVHIDGTNYPGSALKDISKTPGKRELQAGVVALAMGPSSTLIGIFRGPGAKVAGQIKALVERLEASGNN